jgi:6-pyruvoyltetrahydropterin/6-carboxytetrahydropterin synthase
MYTVAVSRSFRAYHFLVGGDWGEENQCHTHPYRVEVQLLGESLDSHGYLVDIVDINARLDELVGYFEGRILNELPEFAHLNPSIEHFSRIFAELFAARLQAPNIKALLVKLWEAEIAWAAYRLDL